MTKLFELEKDLSKDFPRAKDVLERLDRMANVGYSIEPSQMLEVKRTVKALLSEKKPLTELEESLVLMKIANYINNCRGTGIR